MKSVKSFGLLAVSAGLFLAGCDTSSTATNSETAGREATAKAPGALPFGNKYMWWTKYDWKTSGSRVETADAAILFDNQPVDDPAVYGGIISGLDKNPKATHVMPGIITYVVANGIRGDLDATDCNVYDSVVVNGVKVRKPTLCTVGGGWIFTHRDTILNRYKRLATNIQKRLDARVSNKQPFIYLLEGDYFQYSDPVKQDKYLSPTYIATLMSDISDTIRKYNPNSRISFNTSGWYDPTFMAEYFRATRKTNFDFTWINTGFASDTLDNNWIKSAISTNTWVRRFTGLPIVMEGFGATTPTLDKFLARVNSGVVGSHKPEAPTAAQTTFMNAANATSQAKALPTSFPDLAPEGVVTSATRFNTSSVRVAFRAWDRDAKIGPTTPSQVKKIDILLNGIPYFVVPGGTNSTNANFSATVSNLPVDLARKITVRITDHDGLVTNLPVVNADSIVIDPNSYAFGLTTNKDAAGAWLPTNAVRFKIPDRTPTNQRVRFVIYDSLTNKEVASVFSDENDASGTNLWGATWTYAGSIQIPSTVKAGAYKFVMMYNDDNLRANYKMAFTLRSGYLRFDPNIVYDPWNTPYCRTGFVKSASTGYCVAK